MPRQTRIDQGHLATAAPAPGHCAKEGLTVGNLVPGGDLFTIVNQVNPAFVDFVDFAVAGIRQAGADVGAARPF